jgi:hypothetical protein
MKKPAVYDISAIAAPVIKPFMISSIDIILFYGLAFFS